MIIIKQSKINKKQTHLNRTKQTNGRSTREGIRFYVDTNPLIDTLRNRIKIKFKFKKERGGENKRKIKALV